MFRKSQRRSTRFHLDQLEGLEPRWVPAALSDLTPVLVNGPDIAAPGTKVAVETHVANLDSQASGKFRIEYRLTIDNPVNDHSVLLKTVTQKSIAGHGELGWSQTLKLPKDLATGMYRLLVVVDPANRVPESNETNNSLSATDTMTIAQSALTGRVTFQHKSRPVSIVTLESGAQFIDPAVTTWIVIHGRNESAASTNIDALATQIDQYQPGDQVLLLDWGQAAASGAVGGQGEDFIRPVAQWAAQALIDYGFAGSQLNLVGYSWGAEVAAEMAEIIGSVNSEMAIDPARDYPGGSYNPEAAGEVDIAAHADHSLAFFATGSLTFGSSIVASTAETSVVVAGTDHFGIVTLVTELIALPSQNPVAQLLPLRELLTGVPAAPWEDNSYSSTGLSGTENGQFEIVLQAKTGEIAIESLSFFENGEEQTVEA